MEPIMQNFPSTVQKMLPAFCAGLMVLASLCIFLPEAFSDEVFVLRGSFYLELPSGWENVRVPAFEYDFTLSAVVMKTAGDGTHFRPQVGITTEYTHHPSAESFYQRVIRDTTAIPEVTLEEEGTAVLDESKAHWFTYLWKTSEGTARVRAYLLHTSHVSYRLLCLASEDTFFDHLPQFETIVSSFRRDTGK